MFVNRSCAKCHNTISETSNNNNLRFHRFPLPGKYGPARARAWAEYCFPGKDWSTEKSLISLHQQHLMLCSMHFDDNAYSSSDRKRMNNFAIPTGTEGILLRLRQEEHATSSKTVTNIPGPTQELAVVTKNIDQPVQDSTSEGDTRPVFLKELVTEIIEQPTSEESTSEDSTSEDSTSEDSTLEDDTRPVSKRWQDEKSDNEAKRIKINKHQAGTDGGAAPAPLSQPEGTLVEFCGIEMVEGLAVPVPLEESAASPIPTPMSPDSPIWSDDEGVEETVADSVPSKKRDDPLIESMERQAAATESLAASVNRLADNVASVSTALLAIAAAIEKRKDKN